MAQEFFWGASTSSHQIEGGNENNWTQWEKENAERLAEEEKKNVKFWDETRLEGQYPENYISGKATDHLNRFEEDIRLIKELNLSAYRFSVEWSRIEPEKGVFNEEAIDFYYKIVRVLKTYNIEPFVTLWHFTLPIWFEEMGGFKNPKAHQYFGRFVKIVVERLKADVKYWITINEPEVYSLESYFLGKWPPQKKGIYNFWRVLNNLVKAHKKAYGIIKKIDPKAQVGIAKNNTYFEAYKNKFINRVLKKLADRYWNDYFLMKIKDHQDFIGLNYYFHNRIDGWFNQNENRVVSDLGWELYPKGIYYVLNDLKKYQKPIYITENGLADKKDAHRAWYIKEILKNVKRARDEGVDVRGYFHWSLLDNFEWSNGFWPRFGLVEVDYKTLKRTIRKSAREFSKIIAESGKMALEDKK